MKVTYLEPRCTLLKKQGPFGGWFCPKQGKSPDCRGCKDAALREQLPPWAVHHRKTGK